MNELSGAIEKEKTA
ncbi:hypothetical protein CGLO_18239 [Colletotrichum gloeosporioides Cg-14]|uniref:Uncharacterized protein n=1 Tax=Colletotrichum gloeosporioides (strain Cg-14) TaxID=1237896 RepID=T0JRY1_COLGC|nr:hypothetical protein CGLO_18239 [Colletotrichum gloeosporioides Cg-14]